MDRRFDSPWQTFRRLADYRGRSTRSELLYFVLLMAVTGYVLSFLTSFTRYAGDQRLRTLFLVVFLVPMVALLVRRLHDQGRSAWWLLVAFPALTLHAIAWWQFQSGDLDALFYGRSMLLGAVAGLLTAAIIVPAFFPGEKSANRYGSNPRFGESGEAG